MPRRPAFREDAAAVGDARPEAYFFYGTLIDDAVRAAVIGRRVPPSAILPAHVDGYRRVYRRGAWYPVLVPTSDARVEGLLVDGIVRGEAERLAAFEGDDYALATVTAVTPRGARPARVFLPRAGVPATNEEWTFENFRRRHRAEYLRRVRSRVAPAP